MNANLICVVKDGRIQESGRFNELRRYENYEKRDEDCEGEAADER
jgi:ribosomal protein S21